MSSKDDVPGMMSAAELSILGKLASLVPKNGKILEIGAYYGRTTSALYHGKDPSVKLTVLDSWAFEPDSSPDMMYEGNLNLLKQAVDISYKQKTMRAGFEYCLSDIIHDLEILQISSTTFKGHCDYDFIFIDGGHEFTEVHYDISNSVANSNTLVFGDDYLPEEFPDIRKSVFFNKLNRCAVLPLGHDVKLWGLIPTSGYWRENIANIFNTMEAKFNE